MFNHWALITFVQYWSAAFLYTMIIMSNSLLVSTEEWCRQWFSPASIIIQHCFPFPSPWPFLFPHFHAPAGCSPSCLPADTCRSPAAPVPHACGCPWDPFPKQRVLLPPPPLSSLLFYRWLSVNITLEKDCLWDNEVKKRLGKTQVGRAVVCGLKAFFPPSSHPFLAE